MTTPQPTTAPADPTTPPPWTWWLRPGGAMWFISETGELRFRNAGGRESEGVVSLSFLDSHYGREAPETCPARPRPTTDVASLAIAAHTTPGKAGEDSPTTPTPDEMREIMDAVSQGPAHVALAVERYGLRVYHNGAEFAIRSMTNG